MGKETIKRDVVRINGLRCHLSGVALPDRFALFDTHRWQTKADGGVYNVDNTATADPVAHLQQHGNYREREPSLEALKALMDDRRQALKMYTKCNNQLLAYERNVDTPTQATVDMLRSMADQAGAEQNRLERQIVKMVRALDDPLAQAALEVKAVGPMTVAHCLAYIDLEKARHASSLWAYAGLDKPSHERYQKGQTSGGNKTLRTALHQLAESQVKCRGPYREVFDRTKERLAVSDKIVTTRNTAGNLTQVPWKETKPSHRHGAALRAIMKHFLADYWFVGRTLRGLDTNPLYAEAMLGKEHQTINPRERGWRF